MTVYNYTSLADLCDESDLSLEASTGTSDGMPRFSIARFPRWRSFAQWVGGDGVAERDGLVLRVSPNWFKPRWARIDVD